MFFGGHDSTYSQLFGSSGPRPGLEKEVEAWVGGSGDTWGLLPSQASWRTQRGSTTSSAAVRSSVRSGWLRCVEPGGVLTEPRARRSLGQCGALGAHSAFLSSYEFMRRSLIFYRNEIQKMTGKVCMGAGGAGGGWGPPGLRLTALPALSSTHAGPPGTVWHIRGGQVPAEQPEGMRLGGAPQLSCCWIGLSALPAPGFLANRGFAVGSILV